MKKMILIIGLCITGLINAEDISSDTVAQFIADVQGKSFEKSPQIIKGWVDFKSKILDMAADELAKKTDKEPALGQVVETMRTLSKQLGVQIVARALEEPMRIIASNAGFEASVIVNRVRSEAGNRGFDAKSGEIVDMMQAGIIDPAKVVRSALQHASSIAGMLLTTEALITEIPEEKKEAAHPHSHGGGMGMPQMY